MERELQLLEQTASNVIYNIHVIYKHTTYYLLIDQVSYEPCRGQAYSL